MWRCSGAESKICSAPKDLAKRWRDQGRDKKRSAYSTQRIDRNLHMANVSSCYSVGVTHVSCILKKSPRKRGRLKNLAEQTNNLIFMESKKERGELRKRRKTNRSVETVARRKLFKSLIFGAAIKRDFSPLQKLQRPLLDRFC